MSWGSSWGLSWGLSWGGQVPDVPGKIRYTLTASNLSPTLRTTHLRPEFAPSALNVVIRPIGA